MDSRRSFELLPFSPPGDAIGRVCGQIHVTAARLMLHYRLEGATRKWRFPPGREAGMPPQRRNGLWRSTCCECFFGPADESRYWEVNVSPSGHWNLYHFSSYRTGMTAEQRIDEIPAVISRHDDHCLEVHAGFSLRGLPLLEIRMLRIAVAVIVEEKTGAMHYFALTHPDAHADFHHPGSFTLKVPVEK